MRCSHADQGTAMGDKEWCLFKKFCPMRISDQMTIGKTHSSLEYRRLNIKSTDASFPISITLCINHLLLILPSTVLVSELTVKISFIQLMSYKNWRIFKNLIGVIFTPCNELCDKFGRFRVPRFDCYLEIINGLQLSAFSSRDFLPFKHVANANNIRTIICRSIISLW